MKRYLIYVIVFALLGSTCVFAKSKKSQEPKGQSTQGVEVDVETSQKIVKSKNDKNPARTKRKNRNKYVRYLKTVERQKNIKRIKERNLDFYNERLELKKNKLEELNSEVKKGENPK